MSGLQAPPEQKESEDPKKAEEEKADPVQQESFAVPSYDGSQKEDKETPPAQGLGLFSGIQMNPQNTSQDVEESEQPKQVA